MNILEQFFDISDLLTGTSSRGFKSLAIFETMNKSIGDFCDHYQLTSMDLRGSEIFTNSQ